MRNLPLGTPLGRLPQLSLRETLRGNIPYACARTLARAREISEDCCFCNPPYGNGGIPPYPMDRRDVSTSSQVGGKMSSRPPLRAHVRERGLP